MSAYVPTSPLIVALAALLLVGVVVADWAIGRIRVLGAARLAAWTLVVATIVAIERLSAREPAGFRMLAIIGVALWAMKAVVLTEGRANGLRPLRSICWLGFVCAWPGMQPKPFAEPGNASLAEAKSLLVRGLRRLVFGAALVFAARLVWLASGSRFLATLPLLPGLSLILHFGIFNIGAGLWRLAGVKAYALFRAPLQSKNLTEFWGRRWNLAFSEMTALAVFRPLSGRIGSGPALGASFIFSGLLHEMAISLPVRAGFGLPMVYFLIHGGLMTIERALAARGRPITGRVGRIWTIVWLLLPLPVLFHQPFLRGVVWPLIGIS